MNTRPQYYFLIDKELYKEKEEHLTAIGFPVLDDDSVNEISYEKCMTLVGFGIADAIIGAEKFQRVFNNNHGISSRDVWLRIIDTLPMAMAMINPKPKYLYDEEKFPAKKVHYTPKKYSRENVPVTA